jgi:hypothetical protein
MRNLWNDSNENEVKDVNPALKYALIERGAYDMTIEKIEMKTAKTSGKDFFNIWLRDSENNQVVFKPLYINSDAEDFVISQYNFIKKAFYVSGLKIPEVKPDLLVMQYLCGKVILCDIDIEFSEKFGDKNIIVNIHKSTKNNEVRLIMEETEKREPREFDDDNSYPF